LLLVVVVVAQARVPVVRAGIAVLFKVRCRVVVLRLNR
jgi:hypothetical protein